MPGKEDSEDDDDQIDSGVADERKPVK